MVFLWFSYGFPMVFPSYRWVPFPHPSPPRRLRPRAFRHVRCRRGVRRGHTEVQVAQIRIVHLVRRGESSRPIRRPMNGELNMKDPLIFMVMCETNWDL